MKRSSLALCLLAATLSVPLWTDGTVHAADCEVTNTSDSAASLPPIPGSLRDCLTQALTGDTVVFNQIIYQASLSDAETTINVVSELPPLAASNVTIDASDRRVTINGSGTVDASGLVISSSNNTIRGLSIVGFPKAGVAISSGAGNVIGGDRSVGGGPNGQGLRLSGNGSFGIELTGSGTTGNTVKGCWIGLDAAGTGAQENLTGVMVRGGSSGNTIGSAVLSEANVIGGNKFEGTTFSGTGTDDNVVIGNTIGEGTGPGFPNGTSGILVSDGAQGTQVGGEVAGEGNLIANNGGNGVEVRSPNARRNSLRGNSITRNARGGIALFDGSNDGVKPPTIEQIVEAPPSGTGPRFTVSGTTTGDGTVEIFSDSGDQGATLLGRGNVPAGSYVVVVDGYPGGGGGYLNVTGTFTDTNGNTSPLGIFGVTRDEDTDSDGVPDEIEVAAGTSPIDPLSAPTFAGPLTASKLGIKLNFSKASSDAIDLKGTVTLPPGFPLAGVRVAVWISRHGNELILDDKGKAKSSDGLVSIALKTSSKTGLTTVQYKVKKSALQADVGPLGLDDRTTPATGVALVTPFVITTSSAVGASLYHGVAVQTYKAKQGKTGKASNAK